MSAAFLHTTHAAMPVFHPFLARNHHAIVRPQNLAAMRRTALVSQHRVLPRVMPRVSMFQATHLPIHPAAMPVMPKPVIVTPPATLPTHSTSTLSDPEILNLTLPPINLNLLGLQVQTSQIQVTVSAVSGNGQLLGNLLTDISGLLNLQGVNTALNNVLGSVVTLLNQGSLAVNGVNTNGVLGNNTTQTTTPILSVHVAPVNLNLLGAVVQTSPIQLTITAHTGSGLVLGNLLTDLANLFNTPPPNGKLDLNFVDNKLKVLINEINAAIPGVANVTAPPVVIPAGSQQVISLSVPPINLNLLGLLLKTSQIQVNATSTSGNGNLVGNILNDLLNTLGATPQNLSSINTDVNTILAKVVTVLNATSLVLPTGILGSLSSVLQELASPTLVSATPASTPILNLSILSPDASPPVDVNLLGLDVTTSNIQAQLIAQTGDGQILGNLLFNVANLLNPGGSLNLLTILNQLGI